MTKQGSDTQNLRSFISNLLLKEIRCISVEGRVINQGRTVPTQAAVNIDDKFDYRVEGQTFICTYGAQVSISDGDGAIAEVSTRYALIHALKSDSQASEHEMANYARYNGLFIAYPYIRETIQSTVSRIGMGNLVLDILERNFPVSQNNDEKAEQSE
jgi:preprotein translocase subunit SecB